MPVTIRYLEPADQEVVKALILEGLEEHWGKINPDINPDLNDLAATYSGEVFLVATISGRAVGCGALVRRSDTTGEIVRVSVALKNRRQGIGYTILGALCEEARSKGMQRLVLETTTVWTGVRRFYERFGFKYTHFVADEFGGQAHYELIL